MYYRSVNGYELFLLGRTLMKLGQQAMPGEDELPASVRAVMDDVFAHPNSSVGDIVARTGFPQSHVSASITKLKEAGVLVAAVDLKDRRRILIRRSPKAPRNTAAPIDEVLAGALGTDDPAALATVVSALEALSRLRTQ
jgi:DNA-binding MarR family transcriptional regulator